MNRTAILTMLLFCLIKTNKSFCSDTTLTNTKWFYSVSAGPTFNTVYGSMVARNNEFEGKYKQEKQAGYAISFTVERKLSDMFYINTGIGYIQKQVNPMANGSSVYLDELKTGYLSIPIGFGITLFPPETKVNLTILGGTFTNFKLIDKSYVGPDRVEFKTSSLSESISGGARLNIYAQGTKWFFFQYNYIQDITNSYVESLYWNSTEPHKNFYYKYKTHSASIGIRWHF